jgi:hypothetical protein
VPTSYEASALTSASPEAVWALWTDVSTWADGDHMESASIEGEFQVGATITTKAAGFPATKLTVTEMEWPRLWVDESRAPGVRSRFEHAIEPGSDGTKLTERAVFSGPLAGLVAPLLRKRLERLLAASVAHLARAAEQPA